MQSLDQNLNDKNVKEYLYQIPRIKLRYLRTKNINVWEYINNRYDDSESFNESLYRIMYDIDIKPVCVICGNKVPYQSLQLGYKKTCSKECEHIHRHNISAQISKINTPEVRQKIKNTLYKKYGSYTTFGSDIIRNKIQQTNLQKYGSISPFGSKDIQQKLKETKIERYGDENYNNREKCAQTKLEKYGDSNYNNTEKRIKTCQEKYGGNAPLCSPEVFEKVKKTNIEKYGYAYLMQNDELKNKAHQTNLQKYGVPYAWNNEKQKQTMIERYGVPYAWNNETQKQTMIERYGVPYAMQSEELKRKQHLSAKNNGHCSTSKFEEYAYEQLINKFGKDDIIRQYYSDVYPYNCDFYIQSLNIYIEIQGSQFHHFHPFNENNIDDINELNRLKQKNTPQYESMIKVWTIIDPLKRKIAKDSNLNFYEFYTKQEFDTWLTEV